MRKKKYAHYQRGWIDVVSSISLNSERHFPFVRRATLTEMNLLHVQLPKNTLNSVEI